MTESLQTDRTRLRRAHERGAYDRDAVYAVLDATPICTVAYTIAGQPFATPTMHWRDGDRLYWHGSAASRMLRTVREAPPVCLTVALFDGLVLARSAFHHSANYRSAVVLGRARPVEDAAEKEAALDLLMARVAPGRLAEVRGATAQEIKATTVVSMPIEEASAKIRTGPPVDDEADYDAVDAWAGVLPIRQIWGAPIPDPRQAADRPVPDYLSRLVRAAL
ncbi:MAG: pyridoxamine 5'-phosphate oxidase family protein [Marivibrio sp.]|uniref:pyridoxamine 5'-phosphate oxidase family protein n=1 Tax=Marivibrio sp. TaxID=2039719 RepID=UPI0032EFCF2D